MADLGSAKPLTSLKATTLEKWPGPDFGGRVRGGECGVGVGALCGFQLPSLHLIVLLSYFHRHLSPNHHEHTTLSHCKEITTSKPSDTAS